MHPGQPLPEPIFDTERERVAYRKGYRHAEWERSADAQGNSPYRLDLSGGSRDEVRAFTHGHEDSNRDHATGIPGPRTENLEFRRGYEQAMAELENWKPGTCDPAQCGHRVCISIMPALLKNAAAIGRDAQDCECDVCQGLQRIVQAEANMIPPEPLTIGPLTIGR